MIFMKAKKSEERTPAALESQSGKAVELELLQIADFDRFTQGLEGEFALSEVSPEVALRKPLAHIVESFITATSKTAASKRNYRRIIGMFLTFLQRKCRDRLPLSWIPLAASYGPEGAAKTWQYRGICLVLRAVSPALVSEFMAARREGVFPPPASDPEHRQPAPVKKSPNTLNQEIAAVRSFLSVAHRDGVLSNLQASKLGISPYREKFPKEVKPTGRRLTNDEVGKLRAAVDGNSPRGRRDLAIIDTFLYLAVRCQELCDLRLSSFKIDRGAWWVEVRGKGGKTRKIKVLPQLEGSISASLSDRGLRFGAGSTEPLFVGMERWSNDLSETRIDRSWVARLIAQYGADSGIADSGGQHQLSPHDLRRTAARNAFDHGANLIRVKELLGHADVKTTAQYIGAYESDNDTAVDHLSYEDSSSICKEER